MNLRVVRREAGAGDAAILTGAGLHPVLRRIYLGRGVRTADDLDLSLDRLLPVSTLESIAGAVELLLAHRARGRVLVIGDFDADGATSTALVVRALARLGVRFGRLPRAQQIRVRLRSHAGDRDGWHPGARHR